MSASGKSRAQGAGAAVTPDARLKEAEAAIEDLLGRYADSSAYRSICEEMIARAQSAIEALDEDEDGRFARADEDDTDTEDTDNG